MNPESDRVDRIDRLEGKGFDSRALHVGRLAAGPITTPIAQTSTFRFETAEAMADVGLGRIHGDLYTRYGGPNQRAVEEKVASLEGAEAALLFGSGMAAISSTLLSLLRPGDEMISMPDIYGGSLGLQKTVLAPYGIAIRYADGGRPDAIAAAIGPKTKVVYLESPTNPLLRLADLEGAARIARGRGIVTVLDATFASPVNQSGPKLGIDFTIHSATKYLGGHHDLTAGIVLGTRARMEALLPWRKLLGGIHEPLAAWLLERSLKTLGLRVERQNRNALALARVLEKSKRVRRVHYPGLASHAQHDLARRQMPGGFGGVLSFEVERGAEGACRVVNRLKLAVIAASLGGIATTVSLPIYTSHVALPPEDRMKAGIEDGLVRVAVGIEDERDLVADFEQALGTT